MFFAAGIVTVLAALFVGAKSESVAPPVAVAVVNDLDMVMIPTPTRNIARGERLGEVEFTETKWPKTRLTGQYVSNLQEFRTAVAVTAIPKLLPIPISAVTKEPLDSNLVVEGIPDGMRAITVKVDAESAVEGWARSGNYVDVMVIRASTDSNIGLETKVIAENIKILSAGSSVTPVNGGTSAPATPGTITLLVTQEDALKIKTGANIGKLTFSLRGRGDQSPSEAVAMNQRKLLGGSYSPISAPKSEVKGYARSPDGKLYILGENSKWQRSGEVADAPPPPKNIATTTGDRKNIEPTL